MRKILGIIVVSTVLGIIALIHVLMAIGFSPREDGNAQLDQLYTIGIPLVTLVLGYYFGDRASASSSAGD